LLTVHESRAQGKPIKVMLEQLAALKGYAGAVEKGYQLAEEGIHLVRDLKSGEFHLHQVFFGSLQEVDEAVLRWPGGRKCYVQVEEMNAVFDDAIGVYVASGWLRAEELAYVEQVRTEVDRKGRNDLEVLRTLTQDGALAMTDGERLRRIEMLARAVGERVSHVQVFLTEVSWLIAQRQKEMAFTGTLKKMYGLD